MKQRMNDNSLFEGLEGFGGFIEDDCFFNKSSESRISARDHSDG